MPTELSPYSASELAENLSNSAERILLYGETGIGKSTLTAELAQLLGSRNTDYFCISADPGSPGFGRPGTVSLGKWLDAGWQVLEYEALCTLDAARFRLPLITAVNRLIAKAQPGLLLIDAPGVVRGIAGAELLTGMVELLNIDTVLMLGRASKTLPLQNELLALPARVIGIQAHPLARKTGKKARAIKRTQQWRDSLAASYEINLNVSKIRLTGTPQPLDSPESWSGRQCAFVLLGSTLSLGEIIALQDTQLRIRLPAHSNTSQTLLIRDARIGTNGLLGSAKAFTSTPLEFLPPPDVLPYPTENYSGGPRPVVKLREAYATLINGVLDDPLLHLRLPLQRRSLLFDLGDSGRLPTRIAHQISDVFISHAHLDHIGGFLWLLRSRLGGFPSCRVFGPPGLIGHIKGLIDGILWDRVGDTGPRFEITEIHGNRLIRCCIQTGADNDVMLPEIRLVDGLILDDPLFSIRTVTLDHGTPVQAYSYESKAKLNVDNNALTTEGLSAGLWLNRLKQSIGQGDDDRLIRLPNDSVSKAGDLCARFLTVTPGEKLVYATDFADTAANRHALISLACDADFLFCEASFLEADIEQARRTGHLTARICGEIATAADVKQLIPFHFSRRYAKRLNSVYQEVTTACSRVVIPTKLT